MSNPLYVGTKSEVSVSQIVTATLFGEGGTLLLDNTNNEVNIRQAWGGGGGAHRAILNMSGLGTLVANLSRIRVGDGEAESSAVSRLSCFSPGPTASLFRTVDRRGRSAVGG